MLIPVIVALNFFYKNIMGFDWNMKHVPRVKRAMVLPSVLSKDEATNLKITDIDSKNMQIIIRQNFGCLSALAL
ncbi:MAG TPA: hypothetical protein VIK72_16895 [Clostridiaceae bacterium]